MRETIPYYNELTPAKATSMFYTARSMIMEAEMRSDMKLVMFQPEELGDPYEYWEMPKDSRVSFFPIRHDRTSNMPLGYVNDTIRKFARRDDYYVLLNQRLTAANMLKKALAKPFAGFHPEIVNYVTASDLTATEMQLHPTTIPEALLSHLLHWNVFHNESHMKRVMAAMRKVFVPAAVRKFAGRSVAYNLGVECEAIETTENHERDPKTFKLIYGGRTSPTKRLEVSLEIAAKLYAMRVPVVFELWLTTERSANAEEKIAKYKKYPFVRIRLNQRAQEFWEGCKSADAFICASNCESYGLSWVEQMYAGAVGVFFDKPWVHAVTPKGYPYIVKTMSDAIGALNFLWNDREKRREARDRLRWFIKENHNRDKHCAGVLDAVTTLSQAIKERVRPKAWREIL